MRFINSIPVGTISAVIFSAVLLLTLMPSDGIPSVSIPHIDKAVHFIMFGSLSVVMLFDWSRYVGRVYARQLITVAVLSTVAGGIIELLQGAMGMGRGADWFDLLADASGAFLMPVLFYPVIKCLALNYSLEIIDVRKSSGLHEDMIGLYISSFPEEERRPLDSVKSLIDLRGKYHFSVVRSRGRRIGFITWWNLGKCIYVEHFAINPDLRSKGFGKAVLELFCSVHGKKGVVLEVELPGANDMADRRIRFYERCGFSPRNEIEYVQPPYGPGLQPVPLMLMTYGHVDNISRVAGEIHRQVYNSI